MPDRIAPETRAQIDAKLAELGERVKCPPDPRLDPERLPTPRQNRELVHVARGKPRDPAVQARVDEVERRLLCGEAPAEIARAMGIKRSAVEYAVKRARARSARVRALTFRRGRKPKAGPSGQRTPKGQARARAVAGARNGRRFDTAIVPSGEPETVLASDHPAVAEERPLFPGRVVSAGAAGRVLKSGKHNRKIGERVLVGRLRGAPIYTLTLPERATCPPCQNRRDCYMNNLSLAWRIEPGAELEAALVDEVFALAEANPGGFLVRLHIGGDFYSPSYLAHWARLLRDFPPLNVFGFTSWAPESEMGVEIAGMRERFSPRFEIRFSQRTGPWGCFQIDFPTRLRRLGDAVVCPEMRDSYMAPERRTHCGTCGLCWTGRPTPIVFIRH